MAKLLDSTGQRTGSCGHVALKTYETLIGMVNCVFGSGNIFVHPRFVVVLVSLRRVFFSLLVQDDAPLVSFTNDTNMSSSDVFSLKNDESSADDNMSDNPRLYFYAIVYGLTAVTLMITMCIRGFIFMKVARLRSHICHYISYILYTLRMNDIVFFFFFFSNDA